MGVAAHPKPILIWARARPAGASDAGGAIAQYARDKGLDLVVAGSRGHGAVKRALLGMAGAQQPALGLELAEALTLIPVARRREACAARLGRCATKT